MDPEVIRAIYPPLHYLTMGMSAAAMVYLVLGMNTAVTMVALSLIDTAVFVRVSGPVLGVWVVLQGCLMVGFLRYADTPFSKNLRNVLRWREMMFGGMPGFDVGGATVPSMSQRLTRLARWPRTQLQRVFQGTKKVGAETWHRIKAKTDVKPQPAPVAPEEGRENRLQRWEQDLQEREIYLVETKEDLQSWDKRLSERDDNLRELESTLREWEDGLREALEGLTDSADSADSAEEMRDCEGEKTELGTFFDEF